MANDEILYWHARAKRAEWRIRKEMKKDDQIKVLRNKLDYMEERCHKAEAAVESLKTAVDELDLASKILLRKVTMIYGGDDHTISIPRSNDGVFDWKADVTLDEGKNAMIIKLTPQ